MTATVQAGGKIEVVRPDLAEGVTVEVTVEPVEGPPAKTTLSEILVKARGHRSFHSVEEVDACINELRDEWD